MITCNTIVSSTINGINEKVNACNKNDCWHTYPCFRKKYLVTLIIAICLSIMFDSFLATLHQLYIQFDLITLSYLPVRF